MRWPECGAAHYKKALGILNTRLYSVPRSTTTQTHTHTSTFNCTPSPPSHTPQRPHLISPPAEAPSMPLDAALWASTPRRHASKRDDQPRSKCTKITSLQSGMATEMTNPGRRSSWAASDWSVHERVALCPDRLPRGPNTQTRDSSQRVAIGETVSPTAISGQQRQPASRIERVRPRTPRCQVVRVVTHCGTEEMMRAPSNLPMCMHDRPSVPCSVRHQRDLFGAYMHAFQDLCGTRWCTTP